MKIRKTIQFFCLLSTAVMAGCSLDKPIQFGMDCDADRIELESGKVCFPGECPEYEVFFEHKKCPSDAPYCSWLNEKQNCSFLRQICEASFVLDEHGIVYKLGDDDKFDVYHRLYDVLNLTVVSDKDTVGYFDMNSKVKVIDSTK